VCTYIHLQREGGYFMPPIIDEDEDDYHIENAKYIEQSLEPSMSPIVIYSESSFRKDLFDKKYRKMVEDSITKQNKQWDDIKTIIKKEERYERY